MTAPAPETSRTDTGDHLAHLSCNVCYPPDRPGVLRALCGATIDSADCDVLPYYGTTYPELCIVCQDLGKWPCPRCGGQ